MNKQFYVDDIAHWLVSNEGGREVKVEVKVLAVFNEYGRIRYLIKPVAGTGEIKVEQLEMIKNERD